MQPFGLHLVYLPAVTDSLHYVSLQKDQVEADFFLYHGVLLQHQGVICSRLSACMANAAILQLPCYSPTCPINLHHVSSLAAWAPGLLRNMSTNMNHVSMPVRTQCLQLIIQLASHTASCWVTAIWLTWHTSEPINITAGQWHGVQVLRD